MTRSDSAVVAGTPATTTALGRVNAAADGDEPLGEAPDVTIARAVNLVDRQTAAITAIRDLHFPVRQYGTPDVCIRCRTGSGDLVVYPCASIRALEEHGL